MLYVPLLLYIPFAETQDQTPSDVEEILTGTHSFLLQNSPAKGRDFQTNNIRNECLSHFYQHATTKGD